MFKIIFVVILVIAFVPPVRRFLFWLIVGKEMVKEQKKANNSGRTEAKRDGQINVDYVPKETKDKGFKGGQYVDYEEVE
ncbi:DUF4834 domain-containing protein [Arcticibacterium luteifluviistationis]|uniref:DUF4834 domain-containing protein n=1 Tax=Arcticibacterium luteifluviistationis TaxID=1784714 RepID=A0A2Z4G950_9BACT|nr:DUF4834 domain-containing protein [Arcticibacterium luteifluviistationis]AWV97578.1 DUF4834 domain-containing protein [Arcticibacterium luteifluviistationis]